MNVLNFDNKSPPFKLTTLDMTNIIAYVFPACCEVLKTPLQEIVTDVKVSPVINEMPGMKVEEEKKPEVKDPALWEEK